MKTLSSELQFIIKNGINGLGVFASEDIKKGTPLFSLTGEVLTEPTRTSVQIGEHAHIENELSALINHSCQPSAMVDREGKQFISARDIKNGEEITFDYNYNEDVLASPFICGCCGKVIQGRLRITTRETSE